ncbi:MAG: enoyl-CoA hydratase [Rhodococcus sp.]|uniref:enoyl-CoA hydratase n=1 Tax=Rhodococcus TaxID=1827 RepID=UPI0016B8652B|nr:MULTISPECIES: enoyl-CoA hydratase [Rhodococcus]NLV78544.1 enoyl-CoA hydratase [Rhodococcus sp. (in: high G+C Gram-positive bacteria)]
MTAAEPGVTAATAGLRTAFADGVLRLTIARPDRMNAIDLDTMRALGAAITAAGDDDRVRTIVLTGDGAAFCTGADLAAAGTNPASPDVVMDTANDVVEAITTVPVPVVAAVNGPAAGVGVSMAVAADLTYAAESAYFLLAFVNIGLMPDGGASLLIPAAIGRARAAEMALLGDRVAAVDAARFGLVARTLPDDELFGHVDAVAARTAAGPRRALALTKHALNAATLPAFGAALDLEKSGQIELLGSADFAEGVAAMLQKRRPEFT